MEPFPAPGRRRDQTARHIVDHAHDIVVAVLPRREAVLPRPVVGVALAAEAYQDRVYAQPPDVLPAGESIVWSLAKQADVPGLRYPAEDGDYEQATLDALGL